MDPKTSLPISRARIHMENPNQLTSQNYVNIKVYSIIKIKYFYVKGNSL